MKLNVKIIKSKRKSIGVEIKPDLTILVRAPYSVNDATIKKLLAEKSPWIEKKIKEISNNNKNSLPEFTDKELEVLREQTRAIITPKAEYFAKILNVSFNKLFVKKQRSVWGSCSSKKNINFNLLLCLCPENVIDYIVVHELCHLKQLNHSKQFWAEVEKIFPKHKEAKNWLKTEGNKLIKRLPK